MSWLRRLGRRAGVVEQRRGPQAGFHLWWGPIALEPGEFIVECAVTLRILEAPSTPTLTFWALQATFVDPAGASMGAAHLGLQWNPRHPDQRAANWGGYRKTHDVTSILDGTGSPLPSAPDDRNTRDYPWRVGAPYRLRIARGGQGWAGWITDIERDHAVLVRELHAGGDRLEHLVMWTELFSDPDDPAFSADWYEPRVVTSTGRETGPDIVRVSYPPHEVWGRLDASAEDGSVVQAVGVPRLTPPNAVLPIG